MQQIVISAWKIYGGIFDEFSKRSRLDEIQKKLETSDIWQNSGKVKALSKERADLKLVIDRFDQLNQMIEDVDILIELYQESSTPGEYSDLAALMDKLNRLIRQLEFQRMFSHPMDSKNAYMTIQAGSGGTEAQDWADMLLRMYLRWGGSISLNRS
jgi:peptide chain release factor 2